jgi:hypothetical protein
MKTVKAFLVVLTVAVITFGVGGALLLRRGFRANATPSKWESHLARAVRNQAIPARERGAKNPFSATSKAGTFSWPCAPVVMESTAAGKRRWGGIFILECPI